MADVAFFAMRFVLSVLVFGIGLRGPSVPSSQDYFLYARAEGHLQEAQVGRRAGVKHTGREGP